MKISPKYTDQDWIKARDSEDWTQMVEIFHDRLEGRFLKPIKLIIEDSSGIGEFSGFSILALDCLVIETLQQFYDGLPKTPDHKGKEKFKAFLISSQYFKECFNEETAYLFYKHFRCGLLHQGQTMKKSKIKIGQKTMVSKIEDGLIIDRNLFHIALTKEVDDFKKIINDSKDKNLRINFVKKMNFICNSA